MTTVQNEAIDLIRKQRRQYVHTVDLGENIADINASEEFDNLLVCHTLSSLLTMLPPQEARIVRCKLNGVSNEEISELMNIRQSTVRVYWLRGRERLQSLLQTLDK